jgi:hypothetical protein
VPVVTALTCVVNRSEIPGYLPLGARLTLDADGGAIAVWAPTGLSRHVPAVQLNESLFSAVFQFRVPTLGDAIFAAFHDNAGRPDMPPYLLRTYSLLGDPALRLSD